MSHPLPLATPKKDETAGEIGLGPDEVGAVREVVEAFHQDLSQEVKVAGDEHPVAQVDTNRVHSILQEIIYGFSEGNGRSIIVNNKSQCAVNSF